VLVARDEQDPARREIEAQVVDRDDARLAPEDGAAHAVGAPAGLLGGAHADLAAAEVGALLDALEHEDAALARQRRRVDEVHAAVERVAQHADEEGEAQVFDAVARDLAADRELDLADLAAHALGQEAAE